LQFNKYNKYISDKNKFNKKVSYVRIAVHSISIFKDKKKNLR